MDLLKSNLADEVDVLFESAENQQEHIVLSREKAERISVWDQIEKAFLDQRPVSGVVIDCVKGGLSVDVGVRAFLPGSQVDIRPVNNLDGFRGMKVECKVIKINKRRGNIVLSRKIVLEEQLNQRRQAVLQGLKEGTVVQGVVKNMTDYGVFVDIGGVDGLLHISDIAWGRLNHPSQAFSIGQSISVRVLKFDRDRERVSLGYKQLRPDPWLNLSERYAIGSRVKGRIVSLVDYGVFLEIEEGVEGLIHVSELFWGRRTKSPARLFSIGEALESVVLDIHPQERRISLGVRQLRPDPWTTLAETCSAGSVVQGTVRNLTDFGVFVEVAEGIDGLVHVSDLSWVRKIKHPSEVLRKGQQVKALVLHIDPAGHRLSLGIKQLQPDAWKAFFSAHNVGEIVQGKVTRSTSFGVFVELEGGIEGLCHHSQIEELESGSGALSVGEVRDFRIIRLQPQEKKIGLSLKASRSVEPASAPIATIGKAIAQTASRAASRSQGPESAGKDSRSS
jgi:small subunit ribosomal protein S1